MDLTLRTESWGTDDQSWLGSRHGIGECASVTLDKSTFTLGIHYPDGYFKSGIALAKITATGKYGPYDNAAVDGRSTLAGFLFAPVPVATADQDPVGAMLDHGKVVLAKLPVAVDAAGQTDVAGRIIFY